MTQLTPTSGTPPFVRHKGTLLPSLSFLISTLTEMPAARGWAGVPGQALQGEGA